MTTIWNTLGIDPTDDLRAIKHAYAARARDVHPEEHPEEFQRLHDAFLQAQKLAKAHTKRSTSSSQPAQTTSKGTMKPSPEETDKPRKVSKEMPTQEREYTFPKTSADAPTGNTYREQPEENLSFRTHVPPPAPHYPPTPDAKTPSHTPPKAQTPPATPPSPSVPAALDYDALLSQGLKGGKPEQQAMQQRVLEQLCKKAAFANMLGRYMFRFFLKGADFQAVQYHTDFLLQLEQTIQARLPLNYSLVELYYIYDFHGKAEAEISGNCIGLYRALRRRYLELGRRVHVRQEKWDTKYKNRVFLSALGLLFFLVCLNQTLLITALIVLFLNIGIHQWIEKKVQKRQLTKGTCIVLGCVATFFCFCVWSAAIHEIVTGDVSDATLLAPFFFVGISISLFFHGLHKPDDFQ